MKGGRRTEQRPPLIIVVLASLGAFLVALPLVSLVIQVPWSRLGQILGSEPVYNAAFLSLVSSLAAAAFATAFGVPLAWLLARRDFRGRGFLRAIVTLPMVLPPVVGGAALLFALGRRGIVGEPLADATGLVLPFSIWGVIVANTFVGLPFLVVTVEGALDGLDSRYESAAASLGAGELMVLRRVTLPMIAPSLRVGVLLGWARALGEFGATITFAGNLAGRTRTLPLAVFVARESGDQDTTIVLSLLLMTVSLGVLLSLRQRWLRPQENKNEQR